MVNTTSSIEQLKDSVIKLGDSGDQVKQVQTALKALGYYVDADGVYGNITANAVAIFQKNNGLVIDGVCGPKTLSIIFKNKVTEKFLSEADLENAASQLNCSVCAVKATHTVESAGKGFFDDGRPKILYERHVMRRRLIEYKIDPTPYIQKFPNLVNITRGGYLGGVKEYDRLTQAQNIHKRAAMESCSWGAYQIMGYYYKLFGYSNVEEMVSDLNLNEAKHLELFVKFIKADARLLKAIQNNDWVTFATVYNGPANVAIYSTRLKQAFQLNANLSI